MKEQVSKDGAPEKQGGAHQNTSVGAPEASGASHSAGIVVPQNVGGSPSVQNGAGEGAGTADAAEAVQLSGETGETSPNKFIGFLQDILRGAAIGVAFIIPGFSGGSVAAILGIYEKLVGAIADLFKTFRKSILTLLPIAIGMVLGVAALIFPIQWGLAHFPIPTVSLFVGLSLGGLPSITEKLKGRPKWYHFVAFLLPCAVAACMLFLPTASRPEGFLYSQGVGGYLLLVLVGIAGSCALVVPGISGSMLLLIFGYYTPLVEVITVHLLHGADVGKSLLILACAGVGVLVGFFAISVLMKYLLSRFPRGTYFAILGFILGSVVAVYFTTVGNTPAALEYLYRSPWYWVATVALLFVGIALSLLLVWFSKKKKE